MEEKMVLKTIFDALDDKFGKDIAIVDISEISSLSRYFVIASGANPNQIKAMCDEVERKLAEKEVFSNLKEGYSKANWVLLEFDDVMLHVFDEENRAFYNLERVWADGKVVNTNTL